MSAKELILNGINITEKDFFPEDKEAISADILAFLAAEGAVGSGFPEKSKANEKLVKTYDQEQKFLQSHLKKTLLSINGLDSKKVKDGSAGIGDDLEEMGHEVKKRKDLPENMVDRVAAHFLLELAKPETKNSFDLSVLQKLLENIPPEKRSLSKAQEKMLVELTKKRGQVAPGEKVQKKYAAAVSSFASDLKLMGSGLWQGKDDECYMDEIDNVFQAWEGKLSKKSKNQLSDSFNRLILDTYQLYSRGFEKQFETDLKAGKNGKGMIAKVSEFAINSTYARDLVSTEALSKLAGEGLYEVIENLVSYKYGMYSAMLLVGWHEGERGIYHRQGEGERVVESDVSTSNDRYLYLHEMMKYVNREVIDAVGKLLHKAKNPRDLEDLRGKHADEDELKVVRDWPIWALSRVADCFADAGYVTKLKSGDYKLKRTKGKYLSNLDYDSLRSVMLAHKYMYFGENKKPEINSLADVTRIYERNHELIKVQDLEFDTHNAKLDTMAKVEYGFQDTDPAAIEKKLVELEKRPLKDLPSVMMISDIVFGTFEITKKSKRWTLANDMKSLDTQFAVAGKLIDRIRALGIKVVVMKGSDAWDISDDHAVMNVQRWDNMAAPLAKHDKRYLNYHDVDRIKQTKAYDQYLKFQWDVVYEYCLRTKRSMLTADEVAEKTGDRVRLEEPLMLIDAYEKMTNGEELPPEYLEVLNIEAIPLKGKVFTDGLYVVDDAHLTLRPENGEKPFTIDLWDRFSFSPDPLIGSPLSALKSVVGAMASEGEKIFDLTFSTNQRWGVGSGAAEGSMVATLPSMQTYQRHAGSYSNATGNTSLRQRMRGTPPVAATTSFEKRNGHFIVQLETDLLREKSYATPPSAIVVLADMQIGGDTARQDLIPKLLDYMVTEVASENETIAIVDGDITHGLNFPGSAIANGPTGLNSTRRQNLHGTHMLEESLGHFDSQRINRIKRWLNLPGNHQWNTATKLNGELYIQWIESTIAGILKSANGRLMSDQEIAKRIQTYDRMLVKEGGDVMMDAWTAVEPVGAFNVMAQHLILDKMAKSGGDVPIFQFNTFINGVGDLAKQIDLSLYGHWHHRQFMLKGNKVAAVVPALAGQSWYEWIRGYRPEVGALVVYLGGGRPVTLDFVSAKALYKHEIKDGAFSPQALADSGFVTDPGFIPGRHGFAGRSLGPKDAIQKKIWSMIDSINDQPSSFVGEEPESWATPY